MTTTNTAAKATVSPASPAWSFTADTMTAYGKTSPATYSLAKDGTLYLFSGILDPNTGVTHPVRFTLRPADGETYAAALAASGLTPAEESKPAEEVRPAEAPKAAEAPKPAEEVRPAEAPKAEAPAPVKKQRAPRKKAEAKPAPAEAPKPVEAPKAAAPVEKPWIGTTISGKGWSIAFDAKVERTCIRFEGTPTAAQKAIVEAAGFYYRSDLKAHVKKLTCKAYRAAVAVSAALNAID